MKVGLGLALVSLALSIDGCTADCSGVGCGLESGCGDYCGGCSGSQLCGTNGQCTASQVGESCQDPRVMFEW